jgi:hypothetical protein
MVTDPKLANYVSDSSRRRAFSRGSLLRVSCCSIADFQVWKLSVSAAAFEHAANIALSTRELSREQR